MTDQTRELTLCVVVRDPAEPLARLLAALPEQILPRADFDVVVVDGTPDGIEQDLEPAESAGPDLTVVRADPTASRPALLNRAWQAATGRGVCFLDVTLVPSPNLADAMARALRRGRRLVSGQMLPWTPSLRNAGPLSYRLWASARELPLVSAQLLGVLRADLEQVSGFDESLLDPDECDTDLAVRLVDAGVDPFWSRHAVAYYDVPTRGLQHLLADRRRARTILRILDDHPAARSRLLVGGLLWHRRHLELLLAAAGLTLAARDRRALLLAAPWLHERTCLQPTTAGPRRKWLVLPGVLAVDLYDAAVTTAARLRPDPRP